uniref:DCC1-like thiol-disulfide oxidoreductase family protein n=1 Tax=Microbulbifer agarilyticus TaxID=260552 RepID=UPI000255BBDF|nr:DCC1-like thiol-disulfide oxidoreductase family protein [Microbulbifer agarilyticus]
MSKAHLPAQKKVEKPLEKQEILLLYDQQCPMCDYYCNLVHIREDLGNLKLIDARADSALLSEVTQRGLDIDQGMVLKVGHQLYYGSDAIHVLSLLGSRSGFFNRMNFTIFRSKKVAHFVYPVLRSVRNLILKIMGRTKINNLGQSNNDRF